MTDGRIPLESTGRELFRFSVSMPIRYGDIDAQRHVNNVAYFVFMEQARLEYLLEVGLWDGAGFGKVGMILAETTCTYKAPAYLGETVTVWLRVAHVGRKSFHFEYVLETERVEIATAHSVQVCYDYAQQCSIAMPVAWREAIVAYEPGL